MALAVCRECGNTVSTEASVCPRCGVPSPTRPHTPSRDATSKINAAEQIRLSRKQTSRQLIWGLAAAAVLGGVSILRGSSLVHSSESPRQVRTADGYIDVPRPIRYAHRSVQVYGGRSGKARVIGRISTGEQIEVDSFRLDWWVAYRQGSRLGYVRDRALEMQPPEPVTIPGPVTIKDWNWYADGDFGTQGAVIWTVEVQNNTSAYVQSVKVNLTTYDKAGQLITSDFTFVDGIPPGGSRSTKSYATYFGTEGKAKVNIVDIR
jgi:hypothetical protein